MSDIQELLMVRAHLEYLVKTGKISEQQQNNCLNDLEQRLKAIKKEGSLK